MSLTDYAAVLRTAPLDLTERDVAAIVAEAAVDAEGRVDYRAELQGHVYSALKRVESFEAFDAAVQRGTIRSAVPFGFKMPPAM